MDNPIIQAAAERKRRKQSDQARQEAADQERRRRKRKRRAAAHKAATSKSRRLRTLDGQGQSAPQAGNRPRTDRKKWGAGATDCPYCGGAAPQASKGRNGRNRRKAGCWACRRAS